MSEVALQKRIDSLENELQFMSEYYKDSLRDFQEEMDRLKLEIAALRGFLEHAFPNFDEQYPEFFQKAVREVNPEFE